MRIPTTMKLAHLGLIGTTMGLLFVMAPGVAAQSDHHDHDLMNGTFNPNLVRVVQDATRPFLDVQGAIDAQYHPFLGCVSGQQEGAMGLHYTNDRLVGDGEIDANQPEALMYERRNGRLFLLGVEYIVFVADWVAHKNTQPPALMGQVFQFTDSPNRYGLPPFYSLHVWAWRDNPHGSFVDWNPRVTCEGFTQNPTSQQ